VLWGTGNHKVVLIQAILSHTSVRYLLVGLVASHGLGAIEIRVDTGIDLVEQVAVVGSSGGVAVTAADVGLHAVGTVSAMAASQARASGSVSTSVGSSGTILSSSNTTGT